MKNASFVVVALSLIALLLGGPNSGWADPTKPVTRADALVKYIVVFNDTVGGDAVGFKAERLVQRVRAAAPSLKIKKTRRLRTTGSRGIWVVAPQLYTNVFPGFAMEVGQGDVGKLDGLRNDPDVAFVSAVRPLQTSGQSFLPGMERIRVRRNKTAKVNDTDDVNVDVDIAVLDTGIDPRHPDLSVFSSVSFVPGDDSDTDPHGHGTHVAGIAAAIDNAEGVYGVAPGARLWAVKVLDQFGNGDTEQAISGLEYVVEHADEIDVVNMSLGGFGPVDDQDCGLANGDPFHLAVCGVVDAGVVIVAAAGNWKMDASYVIPASYDEVITVSAVIEYNGQGPNGEIAPYQIWGADNTFAKSFSNFGWDVDIAAPGVGIHSTVPGGQYATKSGTSMAAPHVAGAAALWIARHGKPADAAGAKHVRDELVRLAFPQRGFDNGFSNDAETYAEPLLNVAAIDLLQGDPLEPTMTSSQDVYVHGEDTHAGLTVLVEDDSGGPVVGLPSNGFIAYLDGDPVDVAFAEQGSGLYHLVVDISQLGPGTHDFYATVKNLDGFERTVGQEIRIQTADPTLVIQSFRSAYPVYHPDGFLGSAYFETRLTDGNGIPVMLSPEQFETVYSAGDPLNWTLANVSYGLYKSQADIHDLSPGTYHLDLTVTHEHFVETAPTSFQIAIPDPALGATLTANTQIVDFTQSIPPQDLDLEVRVESELSLGIAGLLQFLPDPLTLWIDGNVAADVSFVEEISHLGSYRASGIDLSGLPHGEHSLSVHVVDTRGLEAMSNAFTINVIREVVDPPEPPIGGGSTAEPRHLRELGQR